MTIAHSTSSSARRGLRGMLLNLIAEDPPSWPGERYFHDDLARMPPDELREESQRLRLRLMLTDRHERDRWPTTWLLDRLDAIEALIRADRTSAAWSRVRRR